MCVYYTNRKLLYTNPIPGKFNFSTLLPRYMFGYNKMFSQTEISKFENGLQLR